MLFNTSKKPLKILFVASEAAPFIKVGGLGEVLSSLPKALRSIGHDARVMTPFYASIDKEKFPMKMVKEGIAVPSGSPDDPDIICNVKVTKDSSLSSFICYFLENQEYYEKRGKVYGYDDDAARWALLCRGTLEFLRQGSDWIPDVIVASDWQGGLIPNYMKTEYAGDPVLSKIATVFSIHNLYFQGKFDHRFTTDLDFDDGQSTIPAISDPRLLKTNFMRRGIRYADIINTVSENYAKEITTKEYGEGLQNLLQERRVRLFGILNGIDNDANNPETNPYLDRNYSIKSLSDRVRNKIALQKKFNLKEDASVPIFAFVSRFSEQKGISLFTETLEPLLTHLDFQLIVLGTGDSKYMTFFSELEKKYPQVATHLSFDPILPHMIYAGADVVLIPSRFEPSGLTQMEAMRYGAIPLVRGTGGLADSVIDYSPGKQTGTGFVFKEYDEYAFLAAFVRAHETFKYKLAWREMQKRAMSQNFSWDESAKEYVRLFKKAIAFNQEKK